MGKWPELDYEDWKATCKTLQRWLQIVGKIRFSKSPWINHSWHSTFYVTERGLTTSVIHDREVAFSMEFDFIFHVLRISRSDGRSEALPLQSEAVASFYRKCFEVLHEFELETRIFESPNELADATPFGGDQTHCTYEPEFANRFWKILLQSDRLMKQFRSEFSGKASPVHFFWGGFDLAVTRFSGRRAPEHSGGVPHLPDLVTREAYSHEVSSCGFWPGDERFPRAAYYSYAYPKPDGFEHSRLPKGAFFHDKLQEFLLPYDVVREAVAPDRLILDFFQNAYDSAATLGNWDLQAVETSPYLKALQVKAA